MKKDSVYNSNFACQCLLFMCQYKVENYNLFIPINIFINEFFPTLSVGVLFGKARQNHCTTVQFMIYPD